MYQNDLSVNYGGWKATCIGNNSAVRTGIVKWWWGGGVMARGVIGLGGAYTRVTHWKGAVDVLVLRNTKIGHF